MVSGSSGKGSSRRFSPELLQKIKSAVNLVEVVGEHVVLRKSGSNYAGLCPFHNERSPSFSVSENKQLYHCYGCKEGGDLVSFVMKLHGLDFREALEELAERGRVPLPADWSDHGSSGSGDEDPEARKRREEARNKLATAYKLNRFVAAFYHQSLKQFPVAEQYFRKRGLGVSDDLMRSFYLGAAQASWDSLSQFLATKKAPLPLAVELGLIRPSTKAQSSSSGYFDLFRNRAMFPILDLRGRVAGFGGRSLPGGDEKPKYLNSPESMIFHKGKLAFGLFQAQKHIREKDEVILVEGYFDVLALHAAGFQNVVACGGTALTPDHLALFRKFASRVVILFDGDKAGVSATERAMEIGLQNGMVLQGAIMPADLDPDEILFDQETGKPTVGGKEQMDSILHQSQPLIDVRIQEALAQAAEGPEARTQAIKRIAGWLNLFTDTVGREVRIQHLEKAGVSRDLLARAMGVARGDGRPAAPVSGPQGHPRPIQTVQVPQRNPGRSGAGRAPKVEKPSKTDLLILNGLIQGEAMAKAFLAAAKNLPPDATLGELFEYVPAQQWITDLLSADASLSGLKFGPEVLGRPDLDAQLRSILTEAMVAPRAPIEAGDFKTALERAMARRWARFSQRIKTALAEAEAKKDAGLQQKLMKEYLDVQRKMKEFNSFYDEA